MKFCSNCGAEVHENAVVCVKCGCSILPQMNRQMYQEADIPSAGLNVLSFFFPIIGLILFIVFNQNTPLKAKAIGKWAIIGFVVSICLSLFSALILAW